MLFKEGVDNLAYELGKSDDHPYKKKLARDLSVARAEILRREMNKRGSVSTAHSNTLSGLKVIESNLPFNNPMPSKKKVWQTEEKIPRPISPVGLNPGFSFVGGLDFVTAHQYVVPERLTHRTTSFQDPNYYTYFDDYIFFFDNIKYCNVRGVFADILAVAEVKNKDGNLCVPNLELSDDLFNGMTKLIFETKNELGLNYKPEVEVNVDQPPG